MIYQAKKHPNRTTQVQVGTLGTIPSGEDFEVQNAIGDNYFFYIFAEEETVATIIGYDMTEAVDFPLEKGWNPIKVKKVINAPSGIRFGY